ncbi:MAG: MFS transporter, DHA1 family, bicyclomycin/chloramphenicol resistance protein [Rhodobacteraceae bacterium HLUCCA12]|nr:MAG: MFS transporter, DHA1 family, bicyclomycin/chloramphenicol resistance protein [Rhodobacteraceae bacterium HLUCCA12]
MTAPPLMSERRVGALGGLLVATGPVAMALYTPSMPSIAAELGTTESMVQLTLAVFFGGFAIAQLVAGPLSDALGRRPVVLGFMLLFLAGSLTAMLATSIEVLILGRLLQGVGAAVGITTARALVRDLFQGQQSSRILNMIGIILAVAPAISPAIGSVVLVAGGWRWVFVLMVLYGAALMLTVVLAMRETVARDLDRLAPRMLLRNYRTLLGSGHFMLATGVVTGAIGTFYALAAILPFILMERVGLTPMEFGIGMMLQSGSFLTGAVVMRLLMARMNAYRLAAAGVGLILLGSIGALRLIWVEPDFLSVMLPVAIYAPGIAFVMPAMTTSAMAPFPAIAGSASALMGFLQMASGLVAGMAAAILGDAVLAMGLFVPMLGALSALCYIAHRRLPALHESKPAPDISDKSVATPVIGP